MEKAEKLKADKEAKDAEKEAQRQKDARGRLAEQMHDKFVKTTQDIRAILK